MKKLTDLLSKAKSQMLASTTLKSTQHASTQANQQVQPSTQRQFPESTAHNISSCQLHDQDVYPNVKGIEYCNSCQMGMCYICMNDHFDNHCTVDWGFDIFNAMEPSRNEVNDQFNAGYRTLLDFDDAKCPCGTKLVGKKTATVCSACGTATCSAECHDRYVQSQGHCLFIRNFVQNNETQSIQGLRNILWINSYAMFRDNHKEFTECSRSNSKFMKAMLGPTKNTIWLQRGFRHYGQPLMQTLDAFKEVVYDNDSHYQNHKERLCMCKCDHCANISPHPVHNCFYKCQKRLKLDEKTMKDLGFYQPCMCQCSDCIRMPAHMKADCFNFCASSPFTK